MENFIKESKRGFDMDTMSSHSMLINSNSSTVYEEVPDRYSPVEVAENCSQNGALSNIYYIQTL
jgi:hypothetical protein